MTIPSTHGTWWNSFFHRWSSEEKGDSCYPIEDIHIKISSVMFQWYTTGWPPPVISWFINHYNYSNLAILGAPSCIILYNTIQIRSKPRKFHGIRLLGQVWWLEEILVGGLEHIFYDFPYIWDNNPNWRTHIFQDGYCTTNHIYILFIWIRYYSLITTINHY